jgi:glycosyltransferase involved in cell wall biosynthesis
MVFEEVLASMGVAHTKRRMKVDGETASFLFTRHKGIAATIFRTRFTRRGVFSQNEVATFLTAYEKFLNKNQPSVILTYGGDPLSQAMMKAAKRRGIPVVFWLHNFAYNDASTFELVDHVIVPSEFSKRHYEQSLGLSCQVLPYVIDQERVLVDGRSNGMRGSLACREYVTFVNPHPAKGVTLFARIAEQLARLRPDIKLLVIESRGRSNWLTRTDVDLTGIQNVSAMANTHDPRDFYRVTKILLMPSLWWESFGLVAAEAMMNGIPVLASSRGALPETVGAGGFLFDIPDRYQPGTPNAPTAQEVAPWIETIIHLHDDPDFHAAASDRALTHAAQWSDSSNRAAYEECFVNIKQIPVPQSHART